MTDIVGKLWGFCHTLRHDWIDYGDYIKQLTYLLFRKGILVGCFLDCTLPDAEGGINRFSRNREVLKDKGPKGDKYYEPKLSDS